MYDFKYKDLKEIKRNLTDYLVFVKRLMPRWVNGIPDSEIITLFSLAFFTIFSIKLGLNKP